MLKLLRLYFKIHSHLQLLTTHLHKYLEQCLQRVSEEEEANCGDNTTAARKLEDERLETLKLKLEPCVFRNDENKTALHLAAKHGKME